MSSAGSDHYEHWPGDNKHWTEPAVAASGYDGNNGLRQNVYEPPAPNSPSPEAPKQFAPPAFPALFYAQPQMTYPPQPQYYSHPPQQMPMPMGYPMPQPYYTYAAPQPQMPQQVVAPQPQAGANFHVYQPAYTNPETAPAKPAAEPEGPPGNVWLGRTKAQVDEDNMKIAKKQGAYNKRKIAPVDVEDDQMFWVVELDGQHSLRDFRSIKELHGTWKKDPRFEDSYYFVREEEEEVKK